MKRSGLPPRRTPLKRSAKPLKRTPLKTSKTSVKARSSKPRAKRATMAQRTEQDEVRRQVFARDGNRCRLEGVPGAGPCGGRLTFHHRRKDGQGGGYTFDNGATLCADHNDRLEADADLALLGRTMGLVLKRGDTWGPVEERFWVKVNRDGPIPERRPDLGPCWIWTGAINVRSGYGYFFTSPDSATKRVPAHRFAKGCVEALVDELEVDHLCCVHACVHPRHTEQVTHEENVRRHYIATPQRETCAKAGHPITGTQEGERLDGKPIGLCVECRRASWRAYAERKREGTK